MKRTNSGMLRVGCKLSRISFMEVVGAGSLGHHIQVKNEDGFEWSIGRGIIEEECYSTMVDEEKKVSKTALAELLMGARDAIVVVTFNKQANADTVHSKLTEADGKQITKKLLSGLLKGEERTMTGYVIGAEPVLGRTIMIDLEKEKVVDDKGWDSRQRQVDHRTLKSVIYKGVKYISK